MSATRSIVPLWADPSWLQGAAGDGAFIHTERVLPDALERGNLVRHSYRRTAVDGSDIDESGWWVVDRVQPATPGWLAVVHLLRLETGTGDAASFLDGERLEVRTDTLVDLGPER